MIRVRLSGLLRLDSGIRELTVEAESIKNVYAALEKASDKLTAKKLDGCVLLVNGKAANKKTKLHDGDEITFLSPVAGG